MFQRELMAGWGDMDFNAHMRNTAYLDKSADVRMLFFADRGFSTAEFARMKFGPVVRKDELAYFREVGLLERLTVSLALAGLSPDGSHWILRNEFLRADGQRAATVTSTGGWLDLVARKLVVPPPPVLDAMRALERTTDFQDLPNSVR